MINFDSEITISCISNGIIVAKDEVTGESYEVFNCNDFESGAKQAIDGLFKVKRIAVGDRVKVIDAGAVYDAYWEWVVNNVNDLGLVARYSYNGNIDRNATYRVKAIAQHGASCGRMLAYIEKDGFTSACYLIDIGGIQKVLEHEED